MTQTVPDPSQIPAVSAHPTSHLASREAYLREAPAEVGTLTLVVRRPERLAREVLTEGLLDPELGLVGDNWLSRATSHAVEQGRHLEAQINVMSSRMVGLLADDDAGRAEAGDQLYVDLDISRANLPTGTRLALGDDGAVIEVTAKPHNGCAKFVQRFGREAMEFVNSELGKELRLRGLNARVVAGGTVRPGDVVRRLPA
ncbi:MAG: hypothetical protein ACI379_14360 [Nocardioides sp.]|uniref:hypothetical protein n=1 Tax=Nocardioides sp. TaxID=35761 RepID=UPI003F02CB6F